MNLPIRIGLIGLGTVGTGVARILHDSAESVQSRAGGPLHIAAVAVRNLDKVRSFTFPGDMVGTDPERIVTDPSISIVVELVGCPGGSTDPARTWILEALRRGKHVVTANKEVVAKHGTELFAAANDYDGALYFEAAVAGGIPIIKTLQESLVGNRVEAMMGIINGTTNYMLSKMSHDGAPFEDVLREAQDKGYAEADPTSDVGGHDAAYKLAILASIAFETRIPVDAISCEGITRITPEDIAHATELGYVIKLLAIAKQSEAGVEVRVHPTLIPHSHPLAAVHGVFNAIFVRGDAVGDLMLYGQGAGMMPTASAVVADIVDASQNIRRGITGRIFGKSNEKPIQPIHDVHSRFYIHTKVVDRPGVLAAIATALGEEDVSLESVIQKGHGEDPVSLVFVTHKVKERSIRSALERIAQFPVVREIANVIRVEEGS